MLEPGVKGTVHQVRRLVFGGNLEQRINAGFDRPLAEQIATESMDGANSSQLKLRQSFRQPRRPPRSQVFCITGALYLGT